MHFNFQEKKDIINKKDILFSDFYIFVRFVLRFLASQSGMLTKYYLMPGFKTQTMKPGICSLILLRWAQNLVKASGQVYKLGAQIRKGEKDIIKSVAKKICYGIMVSD